MRDHDTYRGFIDGFTPEQRLDAQGALLIPGLVDLHARLRAPGSALEGGIDSELRAAVAGGVTTPRKAEVASVPRRALMTLLPPGCLPIHVVRS